MMRDGDKTALNEHGGCPHLASARRQALGAVTKYKHVQLLFFVPGLLTVTQLQQLLEMQISAPSTGC